MIINEIFYKKRVSQHPRKDQLRHSLTDTLFQTSFALTFPIVENLAEYTLFFRFILTPSSPFLTRCFPNTLPSHQPVLLPFHPSPNRCTTLSPPDFPCFIHMPLVCLWLMPPAAKPYVYKHLFIFPECR